MQIVKYDATNQEESLTADFVTPSKVWSFTSTRGYSIRFVIGTEDPDADAGLQEMNFARQMKARIKKSDVMKAVGDSAPTDEDYVLQKLQLSQQVAPQQKTGEKLPQDNFPVSVPMIITTHPDDITIQVMHTQNHLFIND